MKKIVSVVAMTGYLSLSSVALAEVKVGFVATLSGPAADVGRDQLDGFKLALDQLGGKLGGEPAELIVEDDQAKSQVAVNAVSKVIEREKVDVVTGLTFANVLMSLERQITQSDRPFIGSVAGLSEVAGKLCKPNFFVTSWQSDSPAEVIGKYLARNPGQRVSVIAPNFLGARDKINGFKRFFKGGGEIVEEIYTPMGQMDFSAELTRITHSNPDAVFAFFPGGMGVTFVRQFQQAGLLERIPFYSVQTIEGTTLKAIGDAAVGSIVGETWQPSADNPWSLQFVSAFQETYGRTPSSYAAFSYDAAMLIDSAVSAVDGDLSNRAAFLEAIRAADFTSVRGHFAFNRNNYPIQDYHLYRVVKNDDGKLDFKMLAERELVNHQDAYVDACEQKI